MDKESGRAGCAGAREGGRWVLSCVHLLAPAPRWRRVVAIGCTIVGVAALLVAWQQPGFAEVPPQPIDTSVWVVNDDRLLVGRINTEIGELDSAAPLRGISDVLQDPIEQSAGAVLVVDQTKHELQVLDTTTVTFGARVSIPDDAAVELRGGTLAVADRADGRLWVGDSGTVSSVDARLIEPAGHPRCAARRRRVDPGHGVRHRGRVRRAAHRGCRAPTRPSRRSRTARCRSAVAAGSGTVGADSGGDIQLTTVGEDPWCSTGPTPRCGSHGRRIVLPPMTGAVLQQPGPAAPRC